MNLNIKKIILISLALTFVVALTLLYALTSTIQVKSPAGAQIWARQGSHDFKQIGENQANFKTRSTDPVYIEVRNGENISQKVVYPQRRKTVSVSLELSSIAVAKRLANGAVTFPLIEGNYVYGINPHTNSLTVYSTNRQVTLPRLQSLPFLSKVLWQDSHHYIYLTLSGDAGEVSGGKVKKVGEFYGDIASLGDKLVFIRPGGVFLGSFDGKNEPQRIDSQINNTSPLIFADKQQIFLANLLYKGTQDSDSLNDKFVGGQTQLKVFDASGREKLSFALELREKLYRVVRIDDQTLAFLDPTGLHLLNTDSRSLELKEFSFGKVKDLLVYRDKILLLGDSGLWQYEKNKDEYHKIASYPTGEEYVENSLTLIGDSIYFSTSISDQELLKTSATPAINSFYQLQLK